MFNAVDGIDRPLEVRVSFWQCFKAGFAGTCGVIVAMTIAGALYFLVAARVMSALILRAF